MWFIFKQAKTVIFMYISVKLPLLISSNYWRELLFASKFACWRALAQCHTCGRWLKEVRVGVGSVLQALSRACAMSCRWQVAHTHTCMRLIVLKIMFMMTFIGGGICMWLVIVPGILVAATWRDFASILPGRHSALLQFH